MTGDLNRSMFSSLSFSSGSPLTSGGALAAELKTPIELTLSSRLISRVASRPLMTGSWMSINTKWKPPPRHLLTASRPFMAVDHRTLRRLTKASSSLRLIILSSTMRTLMGGTLPFSMPLGRDGCSVGFFFLEILGLGDDTRGGGVADRCEAAAVPSGAGGVGMDGGAGAACDWSEALE